MGVRHQVESDLERDRTVPLFVDVKAFRKELKLKSNDVYALLVARDGRIAWRGEGDIDLDEVSALEAAVAELLEAPVPLPTDHPDLEAESAEAAEDERAPENEGDAHGAGGPAADLEDETTSRRPALEADGGGRPCPRGRGRAGRGDAARGRPRPHARAPRARGRAPARLAGDAPGRLTPAPASASTGRTPPSRTVLVFRGAVCDLEAGADGPSVSTPRTPWPRRGPSAPG